MTYLSPRWGLPLQHNVAELRPCQTHSPSSIRTIHTGPWASSTSPYARTGRGSQCQLAQVAHIACSSEVSQFTPKFELESLSKLCEFCWVLPKKFGHLWVLWAHCDGCSHGVLNGGHGISNVFLLMESWLERAQGRECRRGLARGGRTSVRHAVTKWRTASTSACYFWALVCKFIPSTLVCTWSPCRWSVDKPPLDR
jgi:hypothetical protein